MGVDFGKTAREYGRYRSDFPDALFERLSTFGIGRRGQLVLDLGTGTGSLARGFASRGCEVTGIDASESMLEEARRLDREAGVSADWLRDVAIAGFEDEETFSFNIHVAHPPEGWRGGLRASSAVGASMR